MAERHYQIVLYRDPRRQLTLEALASTSGLHPALVERFVEFGLLDPVECAGTPLFFDVAAVLRLRTIERLRREVGINLSGIAVVLDLLDRLRASQREGDR
ncbi:MAG TPA: chaperone modulator CbpM [Blastocatellia bacterium]|nr:chaperone modulator CbpM [Blastocatellia bacterium]